MSRMKKRCIVTGIIAVLAVNILSGCQPAPEAVRTGGVWHAKKIQKTAARESVKGGIRDEGIFLERLETEFFEY